MRLFVLWIIAALLIGCADDEASCPPNGLNRCDPIEQTCCEAGESCVLYYSAGSYLDTCVGSGGELAAGEACQYTATSGATACADGLICLQVSGVDAQPICRELCRRDSDCSSGDCEVELPGVRGISGCL